MEHTPLGVMTEHRLITAYHREMRLSKQCPLRHDGKGLGVTSLKLE